VPRPKIIHDCDPGHDDAIAMVLAARHTDLLGITTVNGNAPLARTTANALVMTQLLGLKTPVHSGAAHPLLAPVLSAEYIHGQSGMDGAELPAVTRSVASTDAVGFIIDTVRANEGTWLVPTGPLTNIALALRAAPDLASRVAGISLMGGGTTYGNRTAAAEFNIWCDPEAAAIVFESGCAITMSGLNLTHQLLASPQRIAAVRAIGTPLAVILADLLTFFSGTYMSLYHDRFVGAPVHDACAVLAITHPELFTMHPAHVAIEVNGTHTRGMTLVDRRPLKNLPAPNVTMVETVDADAVFAVLTSTVASFG
jgi:inosine-uridine nucleoside N-ribohydrolase